jgi:hypothetical protein
MRSSINERTRVRPIHVIREGEYRIPSGTELLVNATPVGEYPNTTARVPFDIDSLKGGHTKLRLDAQRRFPYRPSVDRREVIERFGDVCFPFLQFFGIKSDQSTNICTLFRPSGRESILFNLFIISQLQPAD